jgi:hypothetical protein
MKRLQFRHNNTIWENRANAKTFLENIVNSGSVESIAFEGGLYAEPLVTRYLDEDGNLQVIFAIGVDSGYTKYHTIDSKEIAELIDSNKKAIEAEVERAKDAEMSLSGSIETEIARAMEAELFISGAVNTERDERVAADAALQTQITENIAKIVPVTENLGANIREEYVLKNAKGEELGSHIKVYKDSALVGAEVNFKGATAVSQKEDGTFEFTYGADMDKEVEYLYLIYRNENGGLSLVALDFENFLMENEEGLGIKIVNHKITIKIKEGEKYLTTTEDGLQTIAIDEAIKEAVNALSDNLTAKIDAEIERSTAADDYISGLTAEFSAATVAEFVLVNSAVTVETERAMAAELHLSGAVETETARALEAELFLSGAVDTERAERIAEDNAIKAEIKSNEINSKDIVVSKTVDGTSLTLQTDEITITKLANAGTIYDTNIAVLGTLLKVKKVEPISSNIKSRYELQGADGKMIGDPIEMNIESALISVKQGKVGDTIDVNTGSYNNYGDGDTTMNFVYRLEDGTYELVQIVVSEYFTDSHFGRGLNNQDGVVSLLEGDGNEYLVIGEDSISVVGVNKAINEAKSEANAYSDQKLEESKSYADTRIEDLTSSMESISSSLQNGINNTVNMIQSESEAREAADINILNTINEEVSARENAITLVKSDISSLSEKLSIEEKNRESKDNELNTKIDTFSGDVISYIDVVKTNIASEYTASDNVILETSKAYADSVGLNVVNEINGKKVKDVTYDNGNKVIKLIFADGTVSEGFDASEFVVDGMLDTVSFDDNTNEIKFIWNTSAGKSEFTIPLNKFVDQYTIADDSISFLKISSDNKISVIVDGGDGFAKTISTTEYANSVSENVYSRVNADIKVLSGVIDTQINQIVSSHTNDMASLRESIITYVDNKDNTLLNKVSNNENAIAILNSDKKTEGSVLYRIENEFEKSLITDGAPATAISPDEASNVHSLIRQVTVNGEMRYYVSSKASEIYYGDVKLSDYITSIEVKNTELENRVKELEDRLSNLGTDIEGTIKDIIKSYIVGTENEIKVIENENKLKIGFDDNAIFGEM